jgi:hypothetical protein
MLTVLQVVRVSCRTFLDLLLGVAEAEAELARADLVLGVQAVRYLEGMVDMAVPPPAQAGMEAPMVPTAILGAHQVVVGAAAV